MWWVWGLAVSTRGVHSTHILQVSLGEMGARTALGFSGHGESSAPQPGLGNRHSPPAFDPTPECHKPHGSDGGQGCSVCRPSTVPGMLLTPRAAPAHPSCPSPGAGSSPFISQGGTNGAVRCHQPRDMTGCGARAPRTEQPCLSEPPDTPHNGQMDETLKSRAPARFQLYFG